MNIDHDALHFATRLVEELGESAIRMSRVRLVELTAANDLRAAAFWRDVLRVAERVYAGRPPPRAQPRLHAMDDGPGGIAAGQWPSRPPLGADASSRSPGLT